MKGPVMPGQDFFYQAFGLDAAELRKILLMPDEFIRLRLVANWKKTPDHFKRMQPYVLKWYEAYDDVDETTKGQLTTILSENNLEKIKTVFNTTKNAGLKKFLEFHLQTEYLIQKYGK